MLLVQNGIVHKAEIGRSAILRADMKGKVMKCNVTADAKGQAPT